MSDTLSLKPFRVEASTSSVSDLEIEHHDFSNSSYLLDAGQDSDNAYGLDSHQIKMLWDHSVHSRGENLLTRKILEAIFAITSLSPIMFDERSINGLDKYNSSLSIKNIINQKINRKISLKEARSIALGILSEIEEGLRKDRLFESQLVYQYDDGFNL